ncbi:MAG TPA: type II and III secretion system protein family protein, partial [Vicinamibacterales bacterium]|nr:type II and III secretion system protein family protein [Vicinamibacterales bacterium]
DAMVTAPQQLLIHGKAPGTISLFVWDRAGGIKTYEVTVRRDLSQLVAQVKQLFPGEHISVTGSGKDVVLSGTVSTKYVVDKAADVAAGYVEKKENVVNLLKQVEGQTSNQIMLRVRFAEVSRSALQELGASLFTGPGGFHDYIAQSSTQQFATVQYDELDRVSQQGAGAYGGGKDTVTGTGGKYSFSDLLNLMIFNNKYNIGTLVKAMQEKGIFQSLAEPNLIATNGHEASFLAGGEYPYPVVQPGAAGNAITIQFKEVGVRLNFTPTVLSGDMIDLKVRPEVSSLDFSNAITLEGFRVPAISTRRAETEVELQDGQTFAIAGLLNNSVNDTMRKIPGIGDVPVLGWLFKSKAMQKNQTELVVMITPLIVRRGSTGVSDALPSLVTPFLDKPAKTLPPPAPYTGSPVYPATDKPKAQGGSGGDVPAQPQPAPAQAQVPQPPAAAPDPAPVAPPPQLSKAEKKRQEQEAKKQAADAKAKAEADRKAAAQAAKDAAKQKKLDEEKA